MIIADTGFWFALFDRRDNHHQAARAFFVTLKEPFIKTLPVLTEVCYLLQTLCYPLKQYLRQKSRGFCMNSTDFCGLENAIVN